MTSASNASVSTLPLTLTEVIQPMRDQLTRLTEAFDTFANTTAHLSQQVSAQNLQLKILEEQITSLRNTHQVTLVHPVLRQSSATLPQVQSSAAELPKRDPILVNAKKAMKAGLLAYNQGNYPLAMALFTQAIECGKLPDIDIAGAYYTRGKTLASMELWGLCNRRL